MKIHSIYLLLWAVLFPLAPLAAEFRVGLIGPLSGELAVFGRAAQNGIELAKAERPELFTRVRFLYEDDQWDANKAISAYNKLRTVDRIDLVYPVGVKAGLALAPIVEAQKFPYVGLVYPPTPGVGRTYVIRFVNSTEQYAERLLQYLRGIGRRSYPIVKTEMEFINGVLAGFDKHLRPGERVEIVGSVMPDETDFRTLASRLKAAKIDFLGAFLVTGQLSQFLRQARRIAYKPALFGTDFFSNQAEIDRAEGMMERAVFADNEVDPGFSGRYVKRFGNNDQIVFAGLSYDFALLAGELFGGEDKKLSGDEILGRFRAVAPRTGVSGRYYYENTPATGQYFRFPVVIKEVKDGAVVVKER